MVDPAPSCPPGPPQFFLRTQHFPPRQVCPRGTRVEFADTLSPREQMRSEGDRVTGPCFSPSFPSSQPCVEPSDRTQLPHLLKGHKDRIHVNGPLW